MLGSIYLGSQHTRGEERSLTRGEVPHIPYHHYSLSFHRVPYHDIPFHTILNHDMPGGCSTEVDVLCCEGGGQDQPGEGESA